MTTLETIRYDATTNTITIIDQTRLPTSLETKTLKTLTDVILAIRDLQVRGAPLIGITAAYGLAQTAQALETTDSASFLTQLRAAKDALAGARPTAVNLTYALDRMMTAAAPHGDVPDIKKALLAQAKVLQQEDYAISKAIGENGAALLKDGACIMTICNAGLLATANPYGTALAPVYVAQEMGKKVAVTALETRPILQGARLTAFELTYNQVPTTLIADNMMGWYLATHTVDAILVGCDRVATNGDFANKIGTYTLAVMAHAHDVPFYVCTPSTTIDFSAENADCIEIEHRNPEEIRSLWYKEPMVAAQAAIENPAFDITPKGYVSGFITEKGILQPPFTKEMFV